MSRPERRHALHSEPDQEPDLSALLIQVARGDHRAFELVYGELAGPVYGMVRQVLRDPAQSEEVAQEVLLRSGAPRPGSTRPGAAPPPGP